MAFAGWRGGLVIGAALVLATAGMAEGGNRGGGGRGWGNGGGNWNRGYGNGGSSSSFSIGFSSGGGCWSGSSVAFGYSSGSRCGPSSSWGYSSWSRPCRPAFVQPCRTWIPAYGYCAVPTTCSPRYVVAQPCAPVFVAPRPVCATPVYVSPQYILTDSNNGGYQNNNTTAYSDASRVRTVRSSAPSTRVTDYRAWQIETELAARAKAADAASALAERKTVTEPPVNFTYVVESPKVERQVTHTTTVATRAPLPEPATTTTTTTTTAVASR